MNWSSSGFKCWSSIGSVQTRLLPLSVGFASQASKRALLQAAMSTGGRLAVAVVFVCGRFPDVGHVCSSGCGSYPSKNSFYMEI